MRRSLFVLSAVALLLAPSAGAWTWPVGGPVLREFAFGGNPYATGLHRGIDIGGDAAGPVRAAASGTVSFAGSVPTHGKTVTVETADGYSVTHVHLGSITVIKGAMVAEGDVVGTVGPSGEPEIAEPYMHLGVRVTADPQGYVDPLTLLPTRPEVPAGPDSVPPATVEASLPSVADPFPPLEAAAEVSAPDENFAPLPANPTATADLVERDAEAAGATAAEGSAASPQEVELEAPAAGELEAPTAAELPVSVGAESAHPTAGGGAGQPQDELLNESDVVSGEPEEPGAAARAALPVNAPVEGEELVEALPVGAVPAAQSAVERTQAAQPEPADEPVGEAGPEGGFVDEPGEAAERPAAEPGAEPIVGEPEATAAGLPGATDVASEPQGKEPGDVSTPADVETAEPRAPLAGDEPAFTAPKSAASESSAGSGESAAGASAAGSETRSSTSAVDGNPLARTGARPRSSASGRRPVPPAPGRVGERSRDAGGSRLSFEVPLLAGAAALRAVHSSLVRGPGADDRPETGPRDRARPPESAVLPRPTGPERESTERLAMRSRDGSGEATPQRSAGRRNPVVWIVALAALLLAPPAAGAVVRRRRRRVPRGPSPVAARVRATVDEAAERPAPMMLPPELLLDQDGGFLGPEAERTDSRGAGLALRGRAAPPRARGGLRSAGRHLRPLPAPAWERRAHGLGYGRARHSRHGRRRPRRALVP